MLALPMRQRHTYRRRSMKSGALTRLLMLLPLTLLPILSGCASLTLSHATEGHAAFCDVAKPIIYSRQTDSEKTIVQVRQHNARGVELCQWAAQ